MQEMLELAKGITKVQEELAHHVTLRMQMTAEEDDVMLDYLAEVAAAMAAVTNRYTA